jgi:hypothetical protein
MSYEVESREQLRGVRRLGFQTSGLNFGMLHPAPARPGRPRPARRGVPRPHSQPHLHRPGHPHPRSAALPPAVRHPSGCAAVAPHRPDPVRPAPGRRTPNRGIKFVNCCIISCWFNVIIVIFNVIIVNMNVLHVMNVS